MSSALRDCFAGMPVLITGHTGFKGSWLAIWLRELGARVIGYSLAAPTTPSNFGLSQLAGRIENIRGDVRDRQMIKEVVAYYRPVTVFHLAAQPIVLDSYTAPVETFETNVNGTINVLEAIRQAHSVRAAVLITTDKVYENREWLWGYRENEALGGYDPYSASKAMAELAIAAYRQSYFSSGRDIAIASARAGNVIGGGDFANYRLLPDCMRALAAGEPVIVRNPQAVRPWQHVLESLSGYLWLATQLLEHGQPFAEAWNFGPTEWQGVTVEKVVEKCVALWGSGQWVVSRPDSPPKETNTLRLNWEKAANRLNWRPVYHWEQAIAATVEWFKGYVSGRDTYALCTEQIQHYNQQANLPWSH